MKPLWDVCVRACVRVCVCVCVCVLLRVLLREGGGRVAAVYNRLTGDDGKGCVGCGGMWVGTAESTYIEENRKHTLRFTRLHKQCLKRIACTQMGGPHTAD